MLTHRSPNIQTEDKTDYSGIRELWANERFLNNYNVDIVSKLSRHFSPSSEVLEFGAGIGTLSQLWLSRTGVRPECLEIDESLRKIIVGRGFRCYDSLDAISKAYDGIYTSNVLEHIEDDVAVLKRLHRLLKPGGMLAIYVPAFMLLYSHIDASVGHYRRYGKKDLLSRLEQAQFAILECRYVDSIGFFAWLALKMIGPRKGGSDDLDRKLRVYDTYGYPVSAFLDELLFKHLFGKNILAIARRTR